MQQYIDELMTLPESKSCNIGDVMVCATKGTRYVLRVVFVERLHKGIDFHGHLVNFEDGRLANHDCFTGGNFSWPHIWNISELAKQRLLSPQLAAWIAGLRP